MGQTEHFDRDSTLFVARGLYTPRYETGAEGYDGRPPSWGLQAGGQAPRGA